MRLILAFLLMVFFVAPASAQEAGGVNFYIYPEDLSKGNIDPLTGLHYEPPSDPVLPQVKFLEITPPSSLTEEINRLVEGITVDITPEYDHYGYEIRRYMVAVGNPAVYAEEARRKQELKNIETAEIIFDYWVKELGKKMEKISANIETQNASSDQRTSFKYNSGVVKAFEIEMRNWFAQNKVFLQFLIDNKDEYNLNNRFLVFRDANAMYAFEALYNNRSAARMQLNKYSPFASMIY